MNNLHKTVTTLVVAALSALALAGGDHGTMHPDAAKHEGHDMAGMHKDMHALVAGTAGDPAKVSRTIAIEMHDTMRFAPDKVSVKAGETVRFFIVNKGNVPHEMVIGTEKEIDEHAQMMRIMPNMVHKDANQIRLAPGQRGGIVWQFAKAGTVTYACLVPGHKEAGMVGAVVVN